MPNGQEFIPQPHELPQSYTLRRYFDTLLGGATKVDCDTLMPATSTVSDEVVASPYASVGTISTPDSTLEHVKDFGLGFYRVTDIYPAVGKGAPIGSISTLYHIAGNEVFALKDDGSYRPLPQGGIELTGLLERFSFVDEQNKKQRIAGMIAKLKKFRRS